MKFVKVREEHLEMILRWRTSEQVTTYMYTDIPYSMENQQKWFEKISRDETSKYWVIRAREQGIGLVSLNNIDWTHKRCSWAYYIGDPEFNMLGAMVGPCVYHFAFETLKLHKLYGEVMAENTSVRRIHLSHGCRESGCLKDHVYKYGKYHDVYLYEMLADVWESRKQKYRKYTGEFEI